ncbi:MAG TPA: type II toxin-antitoxin system VapC family toxin [Gemmataceae bacterium]|jgi:predicted nucleic acid-binding protein
MIFAYLDASAAVKRYAPESGSAILHHLFGRVPLARLVMLSVGMAEVVSILVRKHNGKQISTATFQQSLSRYRAEINRQSPVRVIDIDGALAIRAYGYIEQYSINSTDAILLVSALDLAAPLRAAGDDLLLVASDQRLLKAARAEGLSVFDPETQSAADLDTLLGP